MVYSGPHFQNSSLSCTPSHGDIRNERNEETKIPHPRFQYSKEAVKCYTQTANQEHIQTKYFLAIIHENGQGIPQNYKDAVKWYTKAAGQGYADAPKLKQDLPI